MNDPPRPITLRNSICPHCGYSVTGMPAHIEEALCPECGRNVLAFEPPLPPRRAMRFLDPILALGAGVVLAAFLNAFGLRLELSILAGLAAAATTLCGLVWSSAGYEAFRNSRR